MTWVQCMDLFVGWLVELCNNIKCTGHEADEAFGPFSTPRRIVVVVGWVSGLHMSCRGFVVGWVGGLWQERKEHWPCCNVSHLTVRAFEDAAGCLSTVQIRPPGAIQPVIPAHC